MTDPVILEIGFSSCPERIVAKNEEKPFFYLRFLKMPFVGFFKVSWNPISDITGSLITQIILPIPLLPQEKRAVSAPRPRIDNTSHGICQCKVCIYNVRQSLDVCQAVETVVLFSSGSKRLAASLQPHNIIQYGE